MIKRTLSRELPAVEESEIEKNQSSQVINSSVKASKKEEQKGQSSYHSNKLKTIQPKRVSRVGVEQISVRKAQTVKDPQQPSLGGTRGPKLPLGMVNSIRKRATGKKASNDKNLKVSRFMTSKIKQLKQIFVCPICECEYEDDEKSVLCDCPHQFCDSCLQHYVIYKVGIFEEVMCPDQSCNIVMNTQLKFFKDLPQDIRKKYNKIHAFHVTSQDPLLRLCPSQQCEQGILKLTEGVNPKCSTCGGVFCQKCFFKEHEGPCEGNQVNFFENNLHYRQCAQCKNVIEKSQGCNHMTCRCGYQFCYVCGSKWLGYDHVCPNNAGNPDVNFVAQNPQNNVNQGCICCERNLCCGIPRILCIVFLIFPLFLIMVILRTAKLLFFIVIFFVLSILSGMFPAACQLIGQADNCLCSVLMIIFFPITMLAGIAVTMRQIFCQLAGQQLRSYCNDLAEYPGIFGDC